MKPDSRKDIGLDDELPPDVKPEDFRALRRQDMDDLVAEPKVMNACAVVLAYTVLGISDREIQLTMQIKEDQLTKIRTHEAYTALFSAYFDELLNVNSMSLQSRIAGMAHGALSRVFTIAQDAKKDETKLAANRDILDRAGTRVADQAERNKGKPVGLRIVVTKASTTVETNVDVDV